VFVIILVFQFGESIEEYVRLGKNNDFPSLDRCPSCKGQIRLNRHGFYTRNAITKAKTYVIFICRLRCPSCSKTFSLLPGFLLPFFQYTFSTILSYLGEALISQVRSIYYQLAQFYRRRFKENLNRVEMFFRDNGFKDPLPKGIEKAIKLLEMIQLGSTHFVKKWESHFPENLMARSL
jgi:hypothetical protein